MKSSPNINYLYNMAMEVEDGELYPGPRKAFQLSIRLFTQFCLLWLA